MKDLSALLCSKSCCIAPRDSSEVGVNFLTLSPSGPPTGPGGRAPGFLEALARKKRVGRASCFGHRPRNRVGRASCCGRCPRNRIGWASCFGHRPKKRAGRASCFWRRPEPGQGARARPALLVVLIALRCLSLCSKNNNAVGWSFIHVQDFAIISSGQVQASSRVPYMKSFVPGAQKRGTAARPDVRVGLLGARAICIILHLVAPGRMGVGTRLWDAR
jgi:hypothetical protein